MLIESYDFIELVFLFQGDGCRYMPMMFQTYDVDAIEN